jgi:hypothetical protein
MRRVCMAHSGLEEGLSPKKGKMMKNPMMVSDVDCQHSIALYRCTAVMYVPIRMSILSGQESFHGGQEESLEDHGLEAPS